MSVRYAGPSSWRRTMPQREGNETVAKHTLRIITKPGTMYRRAFELDGILLDDEDVVVDVMMDFSGTSVRLTIEGVRIIDDTRIVDADVSPQPMLTLPTAGETDE